jgi:hypothetical protein
MHINIISTLNIMPFTYSPYNLHRIIINIMGCCQSKPDDQKIEIASIEKKVDTVENYQVKYRPPNVSAKVSTINSPLIYTLKRLSLKSNPI